MPQDSVKSLNIAIDARMYGTAQRGIGRYLMKLIEQLEQIIPSPPPQSSPIKGEEERGNSPPLVGGARGGGFLFTIFLRRANFEEYAPKNPNFKKALWDAPWYGLREQLSFRQLFSEISPARGGAKLEISPAKPDDNYRERSEQITNHASEASKLPITLYHFPHWNVPLLFRQPFIVTIHDLELFSSNRTRENTTRSRIMYWLKHFAFRAVFRHAVLASRAIIVPSNVVREQLLDIYPQVRKKVKVIYEAATIEKSEIRNPVEGCGPHGTLRPKSETNPKSEIQNISNSVLRASNLILYVGAAYPHKNLPRLLEAWRTVHKELSEYKFVLVGKEDWFWKRLKLEIRNCPPKADSPLARKLEIRENIVFYGEASDEALAQLYRNAALLVQPSLEEGFSLTPLEALTHGTPVAVSDIPVHREILSEAALYFDPHDPENIAHTMKKALSDQSARDRILQNAKSLLPRYSWRAHAQTTLRLYEESAQT